MNFKFYLEKLHASEEFKKFMQENPEAFLCSGFFVLDKGGSNDNKQHFDYYVPSKKKIFSFQLEDNCKLVPIEMLEEKIPEKILVDYDFDFKDIEKMISDEMIKKELKNNVQKILLSLQNKDKKDFLIGTVFISTLGLLKVRISIPEMEIIEFEKKSFFDMIRKK